MSTPYKFEPEIALAPHVCQQLLGSRALQLKGRTAEAVCTLDRELQRFVSETLQQHILSVQGQNVHDGAVLVADNKSGEILAYVGNVGVLASARFVDGTQARRQAGSTLKPFLYGLAFDKRILTPASLLDDAPLDVPAMNGIYRPENYDKQFHGLVPARTALASSLNIPAVKVLNLVGVEWFVQKLGEFGFEKSSVCRFLRFFTCAGCGRCNSLGTGQCLPVTGKRWRLDSSPSNIRGESRCDEASKYSPPNPLFLSPIFSPTGKAEARLFIWKAHSQPGIGLQSKPGPARICVITGVWVFRTITRWASGPAIFPEIRCGMSVGLQGLRLLGLKS